MAFIHYHWEVIVYSDEQVILVSPGEHPSVFIALDYHRRPVIQHSTNKVIIHDGALYNLQNN